MKDKGKSKKVKEEKQTICCDVETCNYNDGDSHCELKEIHISSEGNSLHDNEEKEETICDSFESIDDEDTYDEEEDD